MRCLDEDAQPYARDAQPYAREEENIVKEFEDAISQSDLYAETSHLLERQNTAPIEKIRTMKAMSLG